MTKAELQKENDALRNRIKSFETRLELYMTMVKAYKVVCDSNERQLNDFERELNHLRGTSTKAASRKVRHLHVVPAGRQHADDMTPARASRYRNNLIEGREQTPQSKREAEKEAKAAEDGRWTIDRLWAEYKAGRQAGKGLSTDSGRYAKYIEPAFGKKEPAGILALDVERLKRRLLKTKSPQTAKHVLNLFTWIINYGVKKGLTPALPFHVTKPTVSNVKTEDLTADQIKALLTAIDADTNKQVGNLMKLALFTGMRAGELFKLKWTDIDFDRGFILIRGPKGGRDQSIPLNAEARQILENHPRPKFRVKGSRNKYFESDYVFPGQDGQQRATAVVGVNRIKKAAGLPKDFRPLHGLRHTYASMLASSGRVDMYTLQKLLTHKSPIMTQRYAHLRDDTLREASKLAGELLTASTAENKKEKAR